MKDQAVSILSLALLLTIHCGIDKSLHRSAQSADIEYWMRHGDTEMDAKFLL